MRPSRQEARLSLWRDSELAEIESYCGFINLLFDDRAI